MSNNDFTLNATSREESGKGASRRLRREANLVPAIIYGGSKEPQNISIKFNEFVKQLENEAFYSHIINLSVEGAEQDVILKDLQRHPSKPLLYHADFLRVSKTKKFTTKVPLHFTNEKQCHGIKVQGGIASHNVTELEIQCLPADLPEFIEVDLLELALGDTLHISDIKLPNGVESVALAHGEGHDLSVVNIIKPRGMVDTDEESSEDEGDAAGE